MIHRFHVQNFRSLIHVSVDLSPVTVLVGKSGTGKSNFVQCARILRDLLASPDRADLPTAWDRSRPATAPGSNTHFEVDFSIVGIAERFRYELTVGAPLTHVLDERLILGNRCLFHQVAKSNGGQSPAWIVEPEMVQLPHAGPIAIRRIPSISEVVIAFTALTTGIGCYAFSDNVLSGGKTDKAKTSGLDDTAANFLDALQEIASNLQDLSIRRNMVGALQRVNPSVAAIELNDVQRPDHVVVGHKYNGKTLSLDLSQESDGFRRFYAHLLALYQRPPKQTLIFEHPEDGIHPGALSLLAEEFKAAPENGRGQVILTTHSPKLLDQFDADQIRVVELDGFATKIGPVSGEQKEAIRDKLLDAGELLTVDPARIQPENVAP